MAYNRVMSRDPFKASKNQYTEFGFGEGQFPNPIFDFSQNGRKSKFPIADPDRRTQLLNLQAGKRTDLGNPNVEDMPRRGDEVHPDYYTCGNTDRYGASPPLVRSRETPVTKPVKPPKPPYMERKRGLTAD